VGDTSAPPLRHWAHWRGHGGPFATKAATYSITFRTICQARRGYAWARRLVPDASSTTTRNGTKPRPQSPCTSTSTPAATGFTHRDGGRAMTAGPLVGSTPSRQEQITASDHPDLVRSSTRG
jgi:hypothetical protein